MVNVVKSYSSQYNHCVVVASVHQSAENGEKAEKEAEPEPEKKTDKEQEVKKAKAKAKKGKKQEEEGFELWNELEVQRIKFMVITIISQSCRMNVDSCLINLYYITLHY